MARSAVLLLTIGTFGLAIPVGQAAAFGKPKSKAAPCYIWELQECQETVYDIEYRKETKKIKEPIFKEIKEPASCAYVKPVWQTYLKNFCETRYSQKSEPTEKTVHRIEKDECGNCVTSDEVVPQTMTCLEKKLKEHPHKLLGWQGISTEDKYTNLYVAQDYVEKEITIEYPVYRPRTITIKIWVKTPYCPPEPKCTGCKGCKDCAEPCEPADPPLPAAPAAEPKVLAPKAESATPKSSTGQPK